MQTISWHSFFYFSYASVYFIAYPCVLPTNFLWPDNPPPGISTVDLCNEVFLSMGDTEDQRKFTVGDFYLLDKTFSGNKVYYFISLKYIFTIFCF